MNFDFERLHEVYGPTLKRLRFLDATERDACEKVVAFQGLSDVVVQQEWERLGRAQRLKHRLLLRLYQRMAS